MSDIVIRKSLVVKKTCKIIALWEKVIFIITNVIIKVICIISDAVNWVRLIDNNLG